jgi:hypothetical protein
MRQQTIDIYTFEELSDDAKNKAREWFRDGSYAWCDESAESIKHFCDAFSIKLKNYSIDSHNFDYDVNVTNDAFRGLTYRQAEKMQLSDGYCISEMMQTAFIGAFKERGALDAFNYALNIGFQAWRDDLHFQETDEYIDECIIINGYEFTIDGERA